MAEHERARRAAAVVACLVATVAMATAVVVAADEDAPRVGGEQPRTAGPAPRPDPEPDPEPGPPVRDAEAHTWPRWTPRDRLPPAPHGIAPALPDRLDPPATSPLVADGPVAWAVAVAERRGSVQVLGGDGRWRTVPVDRRHPSASISPGGTRVAVTYYAHDGHGAVVHDLATGARRVLPFPDDYRPHDYTDWTFVDEDTLLLGAGDRAWAVDALTGSARRLPDRLGGGLSTAVDPTGGILVSASWGTPSVLTDRTAHGLRRVGMRRTGRLSALRADAGTVVGTSYDGRPFAVVVADRETLTPRVVLPVEDRDANYSNWGLGTLALTRDGVVLLRVAEIGPRVDGFRVVAWHPVTGALSVVSRAVGPVTVDLAENRVR